MHRTLLASAIVPICFFLNSNCSDSTSSPGPVASDAGADVIVADGSVSDASVAVDADAAPDTGSTPTFTLKIENYLSWCSVSINDGASNTTATQTMTVAPGTVVKVNGDLANSTFVWGYWYGTDGGHQPKCTRCQ